MAAGVAVTASSLTSRVAGVPKGLAVGYSFPADVAGSVLAGMLLLAGLVLLAARSPLEVRPRALVPAGLAAAAIAAPVLLAFGGVDYVIVRNAILAIVPAAIALAAEYAANRLGLVAAAALSALLLAITLSVSLDARYGHTDWRGAAARLATPSVERAIVVTPFMSRSLWSPYLPGLDEARVGAPTVGDRSPRTGHRGWLLRRPRRAPGCGTARSAERVQARRRGTHLHVPAVRLSGAGAETHAGVDVSSRRDAADGHAARNPPAAAGTETTVGPRRWLASPR